jgi:GNAT superfamily N-acetyltransferase
MGNNEDDRGVVMIQRVHAATQLLRTGEVGEIWKSGRDRWRSETRAYGLKRDLAVRYPVPDAVIPITVRPLADRDIAPLLEVGAAKLDGEALRDRMVRLRMLEAGLTTCYVAVTGRDEPTYMQWLIGPEQNERVAALFGDRFPPLAPDEMLLEGAFTHEAWRGQKIMAAAMGRIIERAVDHGARSVITFVAVDNIPSLKGCAKVGMTPYCQRTGTWRRFKYAASFAPLAATPVKILCCMRGITAT